MPQISLYVDEETMSNLREDAKREGTSISKYVTRLIKENSKRGGYPEGFFALYGSLSGDDFARPHDSQAATIEPLFV